MRLSIVDGFQVHRPATLLKKETPAQVFFCKFYEIFKNTLFFTEHLRALHLLLDAFFFQEAWSG